MTRNRENGDVLFSAKDVRITKGLFAIVLTIGPMLGVGAARYTSNAGTITEQLVEVQRQLAVVISQNVALEKRLDRIEDRQDN